MNRDLVSLMANGAVNVASGDSSLNAVRDLEYESDYAHEHVIIKLNKVNIKLDSSAEANVLTKQDFDKVVPKRQRAKQAQSYKRKLMTFGGYSILAFGQALLFGIRAHWRQNTKKCYAFSGFTLVTSGDLSGCEDCKALKLVSFHVSELKNNHPKKRVFRNVTTKKFSDHCHIKTDNDACH